MKKKVDLARDKTAALILEQCDTVSRLLKALSHSVRLKVLCYLIDAERTVNELSGFL